ncbi:MAG: sarcosine oxidase subunit delta [Pseudomonadota bacterium]
MLRIPCPFCGLRDHTEFVYEGDATVDYPALDASEQAWYEAVFLRRNPRGAHFEYWHHTAGCRAVLIVERDTLTHEIRSARLAHGPTSEAVA